MTLLWQARSVCTSILVHNVRAQSYERTRYSSAFLVQGELANESVDSCLGLILLNQIRHSRKRLDRYRDILCCGDESSET